MTLARRSLGRTGLFVPAMGFGGGPIGKAPATLGVAEAEDIVRSAVAAGVSYIDTAPLYGRGHSEKLVGHALRDVPRDRFVLATKVGRRLDPPGEPWPGEGPAVRFDYSYDGALRSLEESLARLGLARVDVVLIHDVDRWTHGQAQPRIFAQALNGAWRALERLRREKVVTAVGVGLNDADIATAVVEAMDVDVVLLAGRYTLLEQGAASDFLPACLARGVSVVAGGAFNSGILATGPVEGALYNYAPAPPAVRAQAAQLAAVCQRHGVALATAALQFPLRHPAVSVVIPGIGSRRDLDDNLARWGEAVPAELWEELEAEGLLRPDQP